MTPLILGLIVVAAGVVAYQLYLRSPKRIERKCIHALRHACHGDQDLVERLLFAELQHDANISYAEAARRALTRLGRDRR